MNGFFAMPRGDIMLIVMLLALAVISFLPWARDTHWAGMALLGWMMALLMVLSPAIALVRMLAVRKTTQPPPKEDRQ